ncbi:MAG: hypothetical protein ACLR6B_09410 [Blautia sp.]
MNRIFDYSKKRIAAAGVVAAIPHDFDRNGSESRRSYCLEAGSWYFHQSAPRRQSSDPEGASFSEMGKCPSYPTSSDPDTLSDRMLYACSAGSDSTDLFLNYLAYLILCLVGCAVFGSTRSGLTFGTLVPMIFGLVNYYVVSFRSSPIVPWDLY